MRKNARDVFVQNNKGSRPLVHPLDANLILQLRGHQIGVSEETTEALCSTILPRIAVSGSA